MQISGYLTRKAVAKPAEPGTQYFGQPPLQFLEVEGLSVLCPGDIAVPVEAGEECIVVVSARSKGSGPERKTQLWAMAVLPLNGNGSH